MKILLKPIKEQSFIKGFWKDEKGKLYVDNLKEVILNDKHKKDLFNKNELCIFYFDNEKAYIEDKQGKIDILYNKKEYFFKQINKAKHINALLNKYNGFTVYYKLNKIVIWS